MCSIIILLLNNNQYCDHFHSPLKVHFVITAHPPPIFLQKVEIFTSVEVFWFIMFVCKIFLANSLPCRNNRRVVYYAYHHNKFQHSFMQQCDTVKRKYNSHTLH